MPKIIQFKDKDGLIYPKGASENNVLIARRKTNQVITSGAIQFPIIDSTSNFFTIGNNNSRFTATKNIKVLVIGNLNFYSTTTGFFIRAGIFKNGVDIGNRIPANKVMNWQPIQINGVLSLNTGDYIEIHSVSDTSIEIAGNNSDGSYINIIPIF